MIYDVSRSLAKFSLLRRVVGGRRRENQFLFARQPLGGAQNGPLKPVLWKATSLPVTIRDITPYTLVRAFSRRETRRLTRRKEMSGPGVESRTILFTLPPCLPADIPFDQWTRISELSRVFRRLITKISNSRLFLDVSFSTRSVNVLAEGSAISVKFPETFC